MPIATSCAMGLYHWSIYSFLLQILVMLNLHCTHRNFDSVNRGLTIYTTY